MKRYILLLATALSVCGFVAFGSLSGIAISAGTHRADYNFWLRQQSVSLSGGKSVSATSGYSLCLDRTGVALYHTEMVPVAGAELGPDGKPFHLGFYTDITSLILLPLWLAVLASSALGLLSVGLAAVWFRTHRSRGFTVEMPLRAHIHLLAFKGRRQLAAG